MSLGKLTFCKRDEVRRVVTAYTQEETDASCESNTASAAAMKNTLRAQNRPKNAPFRGKVQIDGTQEFPIDGRERGEGGGERVVRVEHLPAAATRTQVWG